MWREGQRAGLQSVGVSLLQRNWDGKSCCAGSTETVHRYHRKNICTSVNCKMSGRILGKGWYSNIILNQCKPLANRGRFFHFCTLYVLVLLFYHGCSYGHETTGIIIEINPKIIICHCIDVKAFKLISNKVRFWLPSPIGYENVKHEQICLYRPLQETIGRGPFIARHTCRRCGGRGTFYTTHCSLCRGSCEITTEKSVTVSVPAGRFPSWFAFLFIF